MPTAHNIGKSMVNYEYPLSTVIMSNMLAGINKHKTLIPGKDGKKMSYLLTKLGC